MDNYYAGINAPYRTFMIIVVKHFNQTFKLNISTVKILLITTMGIDIEHHFTKNLCNIRILFSPNLRRIINKLLKIIYVKEYIIYLIAYA